MYLIETFNKKEDDKLIDIENGGIYEAMMECDLAIYNIFESLYEIDKDEINGVNESIGDKLKSVGGKIIQGLKTIKDFVKRVITSFINLFKKANNSDNEFVKKSESKMSGKNSTVKPVTKEDTTNKTNDEPSKNNNIKPDTKEDKIDKTNEEPTKNINKNEDKKEKSNESNSNKETTITGYTFKGLAFYINQLDFNAIYKFAYDKIGTSPIDFINKNYKDPVSSIKEARKELKSYIAKRFSDNNNGEDYEKSMIEFIYGGDKKTITVKYYDAVNSLRKLCPEMLKKLNDQLRKVDSIFDGYIKSFTDRDERRMGRYEKIADQKEDGNDKNEMKKDNEYIKKSMQLISIDYLNCINDVKTMYITSLNVCIKAVNEKGKQDRFAINKMLGGVQ